MGFLLQIQHKTRQSNNSQDNQMLKIWFPKFRSSCEQQKCAKIADVNPQPLNTSQNTLAKHNRRSAQLSCHHVSKHNFGNRKPNLHLWGDSGFHANPASNAILAMSTPHPALHKASLLMLGCTKLTDPQFWISTFQASCGATKTAQTLCPKSEHT